MSRRRKGISRFTAGVIGLAVIIVFTYLGFTKFANPFSSSYTIHAIFANANELTPASLVRIAGVNVGKVQSISPVSSCRGENPCSAADVTMTIDGSGLPIHRDATFAIRPRIFLEGNFFVDIHPGSPSAPAAPSGFTFPIQQGVEPVQFDQVLSSLQSNTRQNLQILLEQYGTAVKQGGPAYNASIQYWLPAYKYTAIVAHDFLGYQPDDLSTWIAEGGTVAQALDTHPQTLENLVSDFNTTAGAFARENVALEQAVAQLPKTLSAAIPAFNALNAAFPPTERLATALIPGVKSTGPMVDASLPFFSQLRQLVQPSELQGLAKDLKPTIPALDTLTKQTIPFMKNEVRPASSCVANVIYPWSQLTVPDPHFNASNGFPPHKVYVEAVDYLPGLNGESRNFDANGPFIRVGLTGQGTFVYTLSNGVLGDSVAPLVAAQPPKPAGGKRPPLAGADAPNAPCETQPAITDLSAPTTSQFTPITVGGQNPVGGLLQNLQNLLMP